MDKPLRPLCPRCQVGRLRAWRELRPEEQELARRLPASAEYDQETRQRAHRWCRRCWYETPDNAPSVA